MASRALDAVDRLRNPNDKPRDMNMDALISLQNRMDVLANQLNVAVSALNQSSDANRGLSKSQNKQLSSAAQAMNGLVDAIDKIAPVIAEVAALGEELAKIADKVDGVPGRVKIPPVPEVKIPDHRKELRALRLAIKALPTDIPTVDLSAVLSRIDRLEKKMNEPMVVEEVGGREWEFEIEREDFSDRIKRVVAKEV